jgi:hypothetical protein
MAEETFVQGDTAPDITATIHALGNATQPADLTGGATVLFQMRKKDDRRFTINQPATVVDDEAGEVSYSWAANDLAVPGTYQVQWEVTYPDGKVQTTAIREIEVRRQ